MFTYCGITRERYCEAYPAKYPRALLLILPRIVVGAENGLPMEE
jgi:hypothetical protein